MISRRSRAEKPAIAVPTCCIARKLRDELNTRVATKKMIRGPAVSDKPTLASVSRAISSSGDALLPPVSVATSSRGTRLASPMPSTTLAITRQSTMVQGLIPSALKNSRRMLRTQTISLMQSDAPATLVRREPMMDAIGLPSPMRHRLAQSRERYFLHCGCSTPDTPDGGHTVDQCSPCSRFPAGSTICRASARWRAHGSSF